MKKLICTILFISAILTFSSCAFSREGLTVPSIYEYNAFENDTWLVIERCLVNKTDGMAYKLKFDNDKTLPEVSHFYYDGSLSYKCVFEESSFDQYIFLKADTFKNSTTDVYYECAITYNYEGEETERSYIGEQLTKEKMIETYKSKIPNSEAYFLSVYGSEYDGSIRRKFESVDKEEASADDRAILNYVGDLHKSQAGEEYYSISGFAKPVGDEIRFSTVGSDRTLSSVKADPLIKGIRKSQITSYNTETNEFKIVFEYNKRGEKIIDFDENAAYILDLNGKFSRVGFENNETEEIYDFPNVLDIFITDKYICVKYQQNGHSYLIYEKGASVIANDSVLD